ncbi:helix-turn-helix domain-containing protein [Curtobacterium citreum]|uniref:Helix-turn-helix domain-containing protein n=1 Tax=Curtobacterium citreum TaxID=2036 RepID=A0ABU8Y656_9MICO
MAIGSGGFDPYDRSCASRGFLNDVADPWSVLVLGDLLGSPSRYTDLVRAVGGISQGSLSKTLRTLERDGLITRVVVPERPPRVEYSLTPLGRSLAESFESFHAWIQGNMLDVLDARATHDATVS